MASTISTSIVAGTGAVMLAPQVEFIRKISEYSVHIMLGMLLLSMLALVLNQQRIMFSSLACTAALCVFLKSASNTNMILPVVNKEAKLNVAHINLSNITYDFNKVLNIIGSHEIDLISFQELTPDWDLELQMKLQSIFPYKRSEVRIDPYGMAIFSNVPFLITDTFQCKGIPNINVQVMKEDRIFQLICSYLTPALDTKGLESASAQLDRISGVITQSQHPLIALGEYNMVYWSKEIKDFRSETKLNNSRRGISETNLRVPYDHIFFSEDLECTKFTELKDEDLNYIGILGTYQMKSLSSEASLYGYMD